MRSSILSTSLQRLIAALLLATLSLLLLAACGGGEDEEEPGGTTPAATQEIEEEEGATEPATAEEMEGEEEGAAGEADPCALVTKEEAEAVLGAPVGEPEKDVTEGAATVATCTYATDDGFSVGVLLRTSSDENEAAQAFESARADFENAPVSGIGDDAFWIADLGQLNVLKGLYYFIITLFTSADQDPAATLETANGLATTAVDRLP